jgi:hypothetical protein
MFLPTASVEAIVEAVRNMRVGSNDLVLVHIAEKNAPDLSRLVQALNGIKVRFMGGVFPGVLHGHKQYSEGAILIQLPALGEPGVVKNLDQEGFTLPEFSPAITGRSGNHYTAVVLVDGLCPNISALLRELFNLLGHSAHYIGGGAGSLSLKQKPCVFTAEGAFQNSAVIGFINLSSSLGVRHGWDNLAGPVVATKTRQNTLVELNWRSALDVYREIVEADCGKKITRGNFFEISKFYPFGIIKEGAEDIVRDPLALNERNELVCAGDIPENAVLNVLKAKTDRLMEAAEHAAADSLSIRGGHAQQCMVVDCISRTLVLNDSFTDELQRVERRVGSLDKNLVSEGILSLGEISSYGEGYIEFFNKTIVVGVLYHAK